MTAAWLAACGPTEPLVEVGSGIRRFEAVTDGQTLPVVCGPQGGQHIWTSVRVMNVGPENVDIVLSITDAETGEQVCRSELKGLLLSPEDDWFSFTGVACFVTDPAKIEGRTMRLEGTAADANGRGGASTHTFVPTGPGVSCRRG